MEIDSRYYGELRGITGLGKEFVRLEEGSTLLDLVNRLSETHGKDFRLRLDLGNSHIILINGQNHEVLGGKGTVLHEGDLVVFLPISMGG